MSAEEILSSLIDLAKEAARLQARKEATTVYVPQESKIVTNKLLERLGYRLSVKGDAAGGGTMKPPIFQDGSFRQLKYCLEYRFMLNGHQESVYGQTKEDCYQKRLDMMTGKKQAKGVLTFGEWLEEWHRLYDNKIKGTANINSNKKYIDNAIKELGHIPLTKLTGNAIQGYINAYNDRKNTRDKIYTKLKAAVTMAFNLGKIKVNPFVAVDIVKHQSKSHRPLTFEEQNIMYSEVSKQYFNLFKFCCLTGLRISEALNVKKKDIDYENGQIFAKRLKKRGKEVIAPVPFLPELLNFKVKDKLFEGLTYNGFKCYLQDFYKKVNIKGVLIHNFRSTFASLCYAAGIPIKYIQEWLCHETLAMTMDTYTHLIKNGTSPLYEYIKKLKAHLQI